MFIFTSGLLMMGCLVLSAFFFRFWRRTRDRFFFIFAWAWLLLGAERLGLAIINQPEEPRVGMYFVRLAAFLLILVAIIDKNRAHIRS
jgi:hypothetical protein